jgi:hypothetical protein
VTIEENKIDKEDKISGVCWLCPLVNLEKCLGYPLRALITRVKESDGKAYPSLLKLLTLKVFFGFLKIKTT